MWELAEAKFDPIVVSPTPVNCPTSYYVSDVNFERPQFDTNTILLVDTAASQIIVQALFRETQTRYYYIRAIVTTVNGRDVVLTSEDKYFVKVTNPCLREFQFVD